MENTVPEKEGANKNNSRENAGPENAGPSVHKAIYVH